jgi:Malectin domain
MGTVSVSTAAEQAAVERVVRSKTFARTPRLAALLEYLCQRSLGALGGSIKEYDIATDVFHRPPEFDQTTDAIVRVEMHRLRKKLKEYYVSEGEDDPIEISLQAGKYTPDFLERKKSYESLERRLRAGGADALPGRPVTGRAIIIGLVGLVVLGGGLLWSYHTRTTDRKSADSSLHKDRGIVAGQAGLLPTGESVRILCGSTQTGVRDNQGNIWGPDAFYSGGTPMRPAEQPIYRTRDEELFRAARFGEFSYHIPLKPGIYELHLYFADTAYHPGMDMEGGEGTRTFSIEANGAPLLRDFDIIAEAGPNTAHIKVFKDMRPASDGYLHLRFTKQLGEPLLNGIEILPGVLHRLRPIRIATQDRPFTDRKGVNWQADNYFLQGRAVSRFGAVSGPADPLIYGRERYGHFSYAIPVASAGSYTLRLHFAESYWGPGQVGGGGVGSRIFDVYCNGQTLLKNFDMLKAAGPDQQIVKTFEGLAPSAQGTLLLSFVPRTNYANVSAIEVTDGSK